MKPGLELPDRLLLRDPGNCKVNEEEIGGRGEVIGPGVEGFVGDDSVQIPHVLTLDEIPHDLVLVAIGEHAVLSLVPPCFHLG
ncbi:hypothetical protein SAMN05421755_101151 [Nitrosomonas sp. Nm33]|nr:hypothetical protein SAMN05421755_101151 [Nitrosomonas sp. Nm33]